MENETERRNIPSGKIYILNWLILSIIIGASVSIWKLPLIWNIIIGFIALVVFFILFWIILGTIWLIVIKNMLNKIVPIRKGRVRNR